MQVNRSGYGTAGGGSGNSSFTASGRMQTGLAKPLPPAYEAYVELEHLIYNPGDLVQGQVHLTVRKKLVCDVINVKLYGSARVFFSELVLGKPGVLAQNRAFEQEIVLVDSVSELWRAPLSEVGKKEVSLDDIARMARSTSIRVPVSDRAGLEPGNHDFPFTFRLPIEGLYTSFDARNAAGYVRYFILVQAVHDNYTVLRRKHLFPVVVPVHLDAVPMAFESPTVSGTQNVAKGTVRVTMHLDKRGYVPGEPVSGTICIENHSKESVKMAVLRIVQTATCVSTRPEVEVKQTTFETPGMGLPVHKIISGQTNEYPIDFYIPALVPEFDIDACIKVTYDLVLSVGMQRGSLKNAILTLSTPLTIGTHPTAAGSGLLGGPPPSCDEWKQSAPLSYDSLGYENRAFDALPSTLSQAVGGLSDIQGDEDFGEYAPLLYQYDFKARRRNPFSDPDSHGARRKDD